MFEITDQNQPVSHPASLTCASCILAGQLAAAGKTTRAGPCGRGLLATAVASGPLQPCDSLLAAGGQFGPRLVGHIVVCGGAAGWGSAAGAVGVAGPGAGDSVWMVR